MSYDMLRIQGFLERRVDLNSFCFQLQCAVHPRYAYRNLAGSRPADKSRNLIMEASMYNEVGEIVFQLATYWLDRVQGNSEILADEEIYKDLESVSEEYQQKGNGIKSAKTEEMLDRIGRPSHLQPTVQFEHGYAVLVGVGEHRSPHILPIPATINDINDIGEVLRDPHRCGYLEKHMHLLTGLNATKLSILESLDWLAEKARQDPDATIIFYFSGHGLKNESPGSSSYSLIPYDFDWDRVEATTINNRLFKEKLQTIHTTRLAVILDACHAGGMALTKTPYALPTTKGLLKSPPQSFIKNLTQGTGKVVISSSKEDQVSYFRADYSRSIFTDCLIKALSGEATSHLEEEIGIVDIFTYLGTSVPAALEQEKSRCPNIDKSARQEPVMDSESLENFPIMLKIEA